MPLYHIDSEALERISTHRAMKQLSDWFNPDSGNEGGNYVVTRNDSNYLGGGFSVLVQGAITTLAATGELGTLVTEQGEGFALDGTAVTAQLTINLDTAQAMLNLTEANGAQESATFLLVLYREAPEFNSVAFYADQASDHAAYSLNILML